MKKLLLTAGICVLTAFSCTRERSESFSAPVPTTGPETEAVQGTDLSERGFEAGVALVYVDEDLSARLEANAADARKLLNGSVSVASAHRLFPDAGEYEPRTRKAGLHRWWVVEYGKEIAYAKARVSLETLPGVELVEPSRIIRQSVTVNDPYWSQMWGMNNTSYPGYDVNCQSVWDTYTMGNPKVTVAVVDGGFQLNHPDLAANVASSGHYNYVKGNTTITQHFHGTHVAGTIAAVNNNGQGVTGIAGGNAAKGQGGVKLLSLQVFETQNNGNESSAQDFNRALKEAADKGAVISQNSWGYNFDFNDDGAVTGYELEYARRAHENPERAFTQAIDYFNTYAGCDNNGKQLSTSPMKGGVVIFAAGNDDIPYGAPGNYDGCISVGAMNRNGSRASFSNYGDWVDICAPGVSIMSTYLSGQYTTMSGTSMACPHVSGVAALVVSQLGGAGFTADELRARLIGGAKTIGASSGSKPIGPLVDAMGAMLFNGQGGSDAPEAISDVQASPVGHNVRVDFTTVQAYGYIALAARTRSALVNAQLDSPGNDIIFATKLSSSGEAGVPESLMLAGLTPDTDYYVGMAAFSYSRKYSALSEPIKVHTAANQAPVIELADEPSGGFQIHHYETLNVPVRCTDPDGDAITTSFVTNGRATWSSNNGSQELYTFQIMGPLTTEGNYQGVVTVTDELGAQYKKTILYSVLANQAPQQSKALETLLLDTLGDTKEVDLSTYFTDPDGEPLQIMAASRQPGVATAQILEDGTLQLKAVSQGICQVSVSAVDHMGEHADALLTVLVRPAGSPEVILVGDTVLSGGTLTLIPGLEEAPVTIRLISSSGVVVFETSGNYSDAHPVQVNVDSLAPGIYTLEATYKGQTYTYTIVKR